MRNALTIARKELASYFVSPIAYVVLTVFVLLAGYFFFALIKQFDEMVEVYTAMSSLESLHHLNLNIQVIDPLLHNMSVVMVILVPAITMRSFAEEKRTGTYELLLTAPIRTGEIVAGKFIAAAVFVLIMIALIWIYPIILMVFGNPEIGVMGAGYLALALLGVCFVSIGLFTSSLTQNQIIAAISCLGILLLLYVISWPLQAGGGTLGGLLRYLSLPTHFSQMMRGVIDTSDLAYLFTLTFVALFLTQRSAESARWR
jgi:gliding motility-associated transport system permease protein